ncbi:Protein of unknown function DUF2078, membrane [Desulfofundulus kuznetsovii DSM 6115]|uniref:SHOCT domain-containing protein n=1 Tax=Desulfofundulus kuznetsovii (strain DSM 6115 / VKM B-1805 / 17) TaxID=760568 RepID=A0AAU8PLH7_DESK7|nr:Protein of unknown function DUF2078, membrane [Desulfofundulus kuznetsovii DSM 6115]
MIALAGFFLTFWVDQAEQSGQVTPDQARAWRQHFQYMRVLLGLIYLGFYLWERRNKNNVVTTGPDPVEVVKMRYARGEISAEEYHRLKEELRKE